MEPDGNMIRSIGAFLLSHDIDPRSFLTTRQINVYQLTVRHPGIELDGVAKLLHNTPKGVSQYYARIRARLIPLLPNDTEASLLAHLKDAANATPPETSRSVSPATETISASPDPSELGRIPTQALGRYLVKLAVAADEAGVEVSLSPLEKKAIDALRDKPSLSNKELAQIIDSAESSISRIKHRLRNKLYDSLPEDTRRQEVGHFIDEVQRNQEASNQESTIGTGVGAIRVMINILHKHGVDPFSYLTSRQGHALKTILQHPELNERRIADKLSADQAGFWRFCRRIVKRLSSQIPPDAHFCPYLIKLLRPVTPLIRKPKSSLSPPAAKTLDTSGPAFLLYDRPTIKSARRKS